MTNYLKSFLFLGGLLLIGAGCFQSADQIEPLASGETETANDTPVLIHELTDGSYSMNEESSVRWTGYGIGKSHTGTFDISEGAFTVTDGMISDFSVTIDTTSFTSDDIQNPSLREGFDNHLKSADFLDVESFATAQGILSGDINNVNDNTYSYSMDLTIKGETESVQGEFDVESADDSAITLSSSIAIDRTVWGITSRSSNFFDNLGDELIEDNVDLEFSLDLSRVE